MLALVACARAAESPAPPAPDYAQAAAWAAWPGRASGADTVPPGLADEPTPEAQKADTFFIHPTTYLSGAAPNARYDEPGATSARIDRGVLRFQASAFNGCCRIYAPRYRQAALAAFERRHAAKEAPAAFELAYEDVRRAFDYYLAHENHGRPFILASHSQGSLHAMRLLQERIAQQPAQRLLVVAYIVGYAVPEEVASAGVPVCRSAGQTGCFVDWNTVRTGTTRGARQDRLVWLEGQYQRVDGRKPICVNPLDWTIDGEAPAAANLGSLPAVSESAELQAPIPQLTGARCQNGALEVTIPWDRSRGLADLLTFFGSYHVFDYNLFYSNIRRNARERIAAWRSTHTG